MAATSSLFQPVSIGTQKLSHRVAQAPCTRFRAAKAGTAYSPTDIMVEYYGQRASKGGLQITEATSISSTAAGYTNCPGMFNDDQIASWKKVTDAVHAKGGLISCQLWHTGRANIAPLINGIQPLSSTSTPLKGPSPIEGYDFSKAPPREMTKKDMEDVIADFASASKNAIEKAGFDFVEIHGANGYLLDQFFHDNVNTRDDEYGGKSMENRARFPFEVIEAVIKAIGSTKTAIRLSPYNYFQDTRDSDPNAMWSYICQKLVDLPEPIAYVHMIEPRFDEILSAEDKIKSLGTETKSSEFSLDVFRKILNKKNILFVAAGGFDAKTADEKISSGGADVIAFGRSFIANPDLPIRLQKELPLNKHDRSTFYGASPPSKGYVDYPVFEDSGLSKA